MPNVWREEIARFGTAPGQFANPWHDEIGRFAPKGQGRTGGFQETVKRKFDKFLDSWLGPNGFDPDALDAWVEDMKQAGRDSLDDLNKSVPVVSDIPTESKLTGEIPVSKIEESVRALSESLVGIEPSPTIREQVRDWFKRFFDTGPAEARPVFPWLSNDTPYLRGQRR